MERKLNLEKFKSYKYEYKMILNQKYPFIKYNHKIHLLFEDQIVQNAPVRYGFVIENNEAHIIENDEPLTYTEAIMNRDSDKWLEAMKFKMGSMYSNQILTLVDAPEGVTSIGCKWVYMKKIGVDGQVEIYKARLVAKGFRQK